MPTPIPQDLAQDIAPDLEIDITPYLCPMTFVRTRLALDRLAPGQYLAVKLKGEEPRTNIPATARQLGHEIIAQTDLPGGVTILHIRKKPTT